MSALLGLIKTRKVCINFNAIIAARYLTVDVEQRNKKQNRIDLLMLSFFAVRGAIFGVLIGIVIAVTYGYSLFSSVFIQEGNSPDSGAFTFTRYLYEYSVYKISHLLQPVPGALDWLWRNSKGAAQIAEAWNIDMYKYGKASVEYWLLQNQSFAYSIVVLSAIICALSAILIYILYLTFFSESVED